MKIMSTISLNTVFFHWVLWSVFSRIRTEYGEIRSGNHEPRYNKNFRKDFMKTSRLKNKAAIKSRDPTEIANYQKY